MINKSLLYISKQKKAIERAELDNFPIHIIIGCDMQAYVRILNHGHLSQYRSNYMESFLSNSLKSRKIREASVSILFMNRYHVITKNGLQIESDCMVIATIYR